MISDGRYSYHLADIAEIQAKPLPLNVIDKMRLEKMLQEVAEYEDERGIPRSQSAQSLPQAVVNGDVCKHGHRDFCGFCDCGTEPSHMR